MLYLTLKFLHIFAAIAFLGAGMATAFVKLQADRSADLQVVAWCQQQVVRNDWVFTVPAGIVLPLTGFALVHLGGASLTTPWILWGIIGYTIAGLTWLPAAFLQVRMRRLAHQALENGGPLPHAFHQANRWWMALGVPSFLASGLVLWMMVTKGSGYVIGQ